MFCSLRSRSTTILCAALASAALVGCAQLQRAPESAPPSRAGPPATPAPAAAPESAPSPEPAGAGLKQRGRISLYGKGFAGKPTASGDIFDPERLTMAHPTLPFGSRVRVTNLENHKSVEVVVNDRGPFVSGRIADLSAAAARQIGMAVDGVVEALLEVVQPGKTR